MRGGPPLKYIIGMDVGGTKIKTSSILSDGKILGDINAFESKSTETKENIMGNFKNIISYMVSNSTLHNIKFNGIGLAFPGPFDYERGISYIRGLSKYESIYGTNFREELKTIIENDKNLKKHFESGYKIKFANDGDLFALGEYIEGGARNSERAICICIGTGIGSSFLEKGRLIKGGEDVPRDGWIFQVPYGTGIVDDYISARGILNLCSKYQELKNIREVKDLYDLAEEGNQTAKIVFMEFGKVLREIMVDFFDRFKPDTFVMGGQISKSHKYFDRYIRSECEKREINYHVAQDTSKSILIGVSRLFK